MFAESRSIAKIYYLVRQTLLNGIVADGGKWQFLLFQNKKEKKKRNIKKQI